MIDVESLSPAALAVIARSRSEAKRMGKRLVGTEHLLLAVIGEAGEPLRVVLDEFGLTESATQKAVESITGGGQPHDIDDLEFTPRTERLIQSAVTQTAGEGTGPVHPQSLLICMLVQDSGVASRVFETLRIDTTSLAQRLRLLQ